MILLLTFVIFVSEFFCLRLRDLYQQINENVRIDLIIDVTEILTHHASSKETIKLFRLK